MLAITGGTGLYELAGLAIAERISTETPFGTFGAELLVTHGAENRLTLLNAVRCEGNATGLLGQTGIGRFTRLGSTQRRRTQASTNGGGSERGPCN